MNKYISTEDASLKWGISKRRITFLCNEGRIPGIIKIGRTWAIPQNAKKPADARITSGEYIKSSNEEELEVTECQAKKTTI